MALPRFSKPLNNAQTVLMLGLIGIVLFKLSQGRFVAFTTLHQIIVIAFATGAGYALGWFLSPQAKTFRSAIRIALILIVTLICLGNGIFGWAYTTIAAWIGFFAALGLWLGSNMRGFFTKPTTFGSAEWASFDHLQENGLIGSSGIRLGGYAAHDQVHPIHYTGDRHLLTIAPTRSGKGTTAIIPNLLTYNGSVLVIDPKGENALITARQRIALGHDLHILDPWDIASGGRASRFNPLDWLDPADPDMTENAMILADALVVQDNEKEKFWTEEAKALLAGLILHVATDPREQEHRHLPRVRDLLLSDGDDMKLLWQRMLDSDHHIVASTGARCLQKEERLFANVIASAQAQTHFLDSSRLRHSLSASDFKFEDMKTKAMSIYLVLPADRLNAFGRWLRLLIQQAITVNARNIAVKPEKPILFILDEMPSLGKLSSLQQAYALMAGYSMILWGVCQDIGQLKFVYGDGGYESLISNSGVIQYFGSRDKITASYISSLCGLTTVWSFSSAIARAVSTTTSSGINRSSSSSASTTTTETSNVVQRNLAYADELMRLKPTQSVLFIHACNPIIGVKQPWFADPELSAKGVNLYRK